MSLTLEPPLVQTPPPPVPEVDERPESPEREHRSRRRWLVGAVCASMIAVGGAAWWVRESTVSVDDYNSAVADAEAATHSLEDARADISRLQNELQSAATTQTALQTQLDGKVADNARLDTSLAAEQRRATALADDNAALETAMATTIVAARAAALESLNLDPSYVADLKAAGLNTALADALLADLRRGQTFDEWLRTGSWPIVDMALTNVDDKILLETWRDWNAASPGTAAADAAYWEFVWRLHHVVLAPLLGVETS